MREVRERKMPGGAAPYSVRMRATGDRGRHISGAEGVTDPSSVQKLASQYIERAMSHPRGPVSEVVVTVERLSQKPLLVPILPVSTRECQSPIKADAAIKELLLREDVSARAINAGLRIIKDKRVMRGAALIDAVTGRRLEDNSARGIRVTLMGVVPRSLPSLRRRLGRIGLNTPTVIEALTLASKVASATGVVAELCASDDPDYTTGYLATRSTGYMRITSIKKKGSMSGGRVFFIQPGADLDCLVRYLQETPVLVSGSIRARTVEGTAKKTSKKTR